MGSINLTTFGNDRLTSPATDGGLVRRANYIYSFSINTTVYLDADAAATGDPHLQNVHGERFDLVRPGTHVLLQVPRGAGAVHSLLRVVAEVQRFGSKCGSAYFQEINVTGAWVPQGILQVHARESGGEGVPSGWMTFGDVDLKVVRGRDHAGIRYLNFYVRHLELTSYRIGGLLGEDDHEYEATPDKDCVRRMYLSKV